jgi:hypothetical protein
MIYLIHCKNIYKCYNVLLPTTTIKRKTIKFSKSQKPNEEMGKSTKQTIFRGRGTNGQQIHEEMLNIPGRKNANLNYIKISPLFS